MKGTGRIFPPSPLHTQTDYGIIRNSRLYSKSALPIPHRIMRDPIHAPCQNQGMRRSAMKTPEPETVPVTRIFVHVSARARPMEKAESATTDHSFPSSASSMNPLAVSEVTVPARRPFSGSFHEDAEYTKFETPGATSIRYECIIGPNPNHRNAVAATKTRTSQTNAFLSVQYRYPVAVLRYPKSAMTSAQRAATDQKNSGNGDIPPKCAPYPKYSEKSPNVNARKRTESSPETATAVHMPARSAATRFLENGTISRFSISERTFSFMEVFMFLWCYWPQRNVFIDSLSFALQRLTKVLAVPTGILRMSEISSYEYPSKHFSMMASAYSAGKRETALLTQSRTSFFAKSSFGETPSESPWTKGAYSSSSSDIFKGSRLRFRKSSTTALCAMRYSQLENDHCESYSLIWR